MYAAWLIYVCGVTRSYAWRGWFIWVAWVNESGMTQLTDPYVWHDSFMCVVWLSMTHSCVWYDSSMCVAWVLHRSSMCVAWLIHMWMANSSVSCSFACVLLFYMCGKSCSFLCVVWLIHVCGVTHSCVWCEYCIAHLCVQHCSFICVLLIRMCLAHLHVWHLAPSYVWHDSFMCVVRLIHVFGVSTALFIHVCSIAHSCVWHSYVWDVLLMGIRRLRSVASIKL